MAEINSTTASGYVVMAMSKFWNERAAASIGDAKFNDLQYGWVRTQAGVHRLDCGVPDHEIDETDSTELKNWFEKQYTGGRGLKIEPKAYGGFVMNLVLDVIDSFQRAYRFNFHIKIKQASMTLGTLLASGATGATYATAASAMFPSLTSVYKQEEKRD